MKKLLYSPLILLAFSCTTMKDPDEKNDRQYKNSQTESFAFEKEYYVIWNPKGDLFVRFVDRIYIIKDKNLVMHDGVVITPTGKVFLNDGRLIQMKEGKKMYLSGKLTGVIENEQYAKK